MIFFAVFFLCAHWCMAHMLIQRQLLSRTNKKKRSCPFSNIPPAWCVSSHLLRQVCFGTPSQITECETSLGFLLAARGLWTHTFGGSSSLFHCNGSVMYRISNCFLYRAALFLCEMWSVRHHVVIWLLMRGFESKTVLTQVMLLENFTLQIVRSALDVYSTEDQSAVHKSRIYSSEVFFLSLSLV